jgi:hypothetical protein
LKELFEDALLNSDILLFGDKYDLVGRQNKRFYLKIFLGVRGSYKNGHWNLFSEAERRKFPSFKQRNTNFK